MEPARWRRLRIWAGVLGPGEAGSRLNWTDLLAGGGCDEDRCWLDGSEGEGARGEFTPVENVSAIGYGENRRVREGG